MSDQELPVTVAVRRPDGAVEQVRVGTATRTADGFALRLGDLAIGLGPERPRAASGLASGAGNRGEPTVFPPYGRSKGLPIAGATMQDLEFYANGARRTLADPSKARFHDKERALLAVIEAEIARPRGHGEDPPPPGDDDAPPI